ncbi:MAG TPA: hypothetical protein VHJ40_01470 [Actinomycetota bacterium]|nr:hypothetical protein [Actinomycetota bacterium]
MGQRPGGRAWRDPRRPYSRRPARRAPAPRRRLGAQDIAALAEEYVGSPETKAFFRTSEFLLWLLGVLAALFAAAVMENFDAEAAWRTITFLTAAYILSRGLSKAGASRGWEEDGLPITEEPPAVVGTPEVPTAAPAEPAVAVTQEQEIPASVSEAGERVAEAVRTPETKEFFRTSEFLLWLLATLGVLIASGAIEGFGATAAWTFVTILSAGYMLSRGISKAGVARGHELALGAGSPAGAGPPGPYPEVSTPETKEFFRTSEFLVLVVGILGIMLASNVSLEFNALDAWRLLTGLAVAYMISRGISKMGTRQD